MSDDSTEDPRDFAEAPRVFAHTVARVLEETGERIYQANVRGRAMAPEPVSALEVEHARVEYLDRLEHLQKMGKARDWSMTDEDRHLLEVLRLRYAALQERSAEQRREFEATEAAQVIASNTELSKRQTSYAKIVMWVVIVQTVLGALGLAQALHWLPEGRPPAVPSGK